MPAPSVTQCNTCPSCCCPDAVLHTKMSVGSQQLSASNGQAGADSSTLQSLAGGGGKESLSDKVKHPFHHGQSLCCHSMMQHQVNWCCSSATSQLHQPAAAAAARGHKAPSNACVLGVCSHCAAGAAAAAQPVRNASQQFAPRQLQLCRWQPVCARRGGTCMAIPSEESNNVCFQTVLICCCCL